MGGDTPAEWERDPRQREALVVPGVRQHRACARDSGPQECYLGPFSIGIDNRKYLLGPKNNFWRSQAIARRDVAVRVEHGGLAEHVSGLPGQVLRPTYVKQQYSNRIGLT